jgi:hypothetical protein
MPQERIAPHCMNQRVKILKMAIFQDALDDPYGMFIDIPHTERMIPEEPFQVFDGTSFRGHFGTPRALGPDLNMQFAPQGESEFAQGIGLEAGPTMFVTR